MCICHFRSAAFGEWCFVCAIRVWFATSIHTQKIYKIQFVNAQILCIYVLYICLLFMLFQIVANTCDILNKAITRYTNLIANTFSVYRRRRGSAAADRESSSSLLLSLDHNRHAMVTTLIQFIFNLQFSTLTHGIRVSPVLVYSI